MNTQEHTHDSAMSGEVKEKWEDDFINKYESFQFSESVSAPEMQRYLIYIRQQRSLAQQEILDRVENMYVEYQESILFPEGDTTLVISDTSFQEIISTIRNEITLSTLKDTNI